MNKDISTSSSSTEDKDFSAHMAESSDTGIISRHIYDDAFLSACSWAKRLLIPLINEVFGTEISERAKITMSPNEQYSHKKDSKGRERLIKRITDALIRVDGNTYHFEAESKNDGRILMRIAEYDTLIAHNDGFYKGNTFVMRLPSTAVIFLRKHMNLPAFGTVRYETDGNSVEQTVPFIMVSKYSLEYIDERHLYILLPFYLMRYEHALKHDTTSKHVLIENETVRVYDILTKAYYDRLISRKEYEHILTLCNDVVRAIGDRSPIKERLVDAMGTGVLKTMEERGYEKGRYEEKEDGLKAMVDTLKNILPDFDTVYEHIVANKTYANLTKDDVRKYY
ncbi:MAG: hypothetical protein E7241_06695 [Lachnospiraceae bacterium]|nr:hypothetical protein [Lachnospiraceae bacterium]